MPLIKAQCTNCNGLLEVDETKDAAICPYCGSAYVVEKAVNLYKMSIVVDNATVNVEDGFTKLLNAAEGFEKLEKYFDAYKVYREITKEYPQKFEGWFGLWNSLITNSLDKGNPLTREQIDNYKEAENLASDEQKVLLYRKRDEYNKIFETQPKKTAVDEAREREKKNIFTPDGVLEVAKYIEAAVLDEMKYKHIIDGFLCRFNDDGYGYVSRIYSNDRISGYGYFLSKSIDEEELIRIAKEKLKSQGFSNVSLEIQKFTRKKDIPGKYDFFGRTKTKVIGNEKIIHVHCEW